MIWRGTATDTFSPGAEAKTSFERRREDARELSAANLMRVRGPSHFTV